MQEKGFSSILLFCFTLIVLTAQNTEAYHFPFFNIQNEKVIYGEDNRLDWFENEDQLMSNLAQSTVGLVSERDLKIGASGNPILTTQDPKLCTSEPFHTQRSGPFCSGFLVAPNLIVTAGHCIRNQRNCDRTKFVFGYAKKSEDHNPASLLESDVYSCKKLIDREQVRTGADWAVIELDREVEGHKPVRLRREGEISLNAPLTMIGHPSGLPSKIASGANVRSIEKDFFVANTDSYGGNSGSAVFNTKTGEVEGILVRGARDYIYKNGCRVSNVCANDECRGEDVTLISKVLHLVPDEVEPPKLPIEDSSEETESAFHF